MKSLFDKNTKFGVPKMADPYRLVSHRPSLWLLVIANEQGFPFDAVDFQTALEQFEIEDRTYESFPVPQEEYRLEVPALLGEKLIVSKIAMKLRIYRLASSRS